MQMNGKAAWGAMLFAAGFAGGHAPRAASISLDHFEVRTVRPQALRIIMRASGKGVAVGSYGMRTFLPGEPDALPGFVPRNRYLYLIPSGPSGPSAHMLLDNGPADADDTPGTFELALSVAEWPDGMYTFLCYADNRPHAGRYVADRRRVRVVVKDGSGLEFPARTGQAVAVSTTIDAASDVGGHDSRLSPQLGGPDSVGPFFALGEKRLRAGEYRGAVDMFRRAEAGDPGNSAPKLALALAHVAARQYWGAARMLRRAVRLLGTWTDGTFSPEDAFGSLKDFRAIQARLREDLEKAPRDRDMLLLAAYLHFVADEDEEALTYVRLADRDGMADEMAKRLRQEVLVRLLGPED